MKSYRPARVPDDPAALADFLRMELQAIREAAFREEAYTELEVLYSSPMKLRPGMVVYADGVTWNPGSGEGLYRRDKTNASWVFLG